ncbi:hypothetical protein JZU71_02255 [bacterium]|nr:hypothetical protein [bacterium]
MNLKYTRKDKLAVIIVSVLVVLAASGAAFAVWNQKTARAAEQTESQVMELLSAGKQVEAEMILDTYLGGSPGAMSRQRILGQA